MKKLFSTLLITFCYLLTVAQIDTTKLDSLAIDSLVSSYINSINPSGSIKFRNNTLRQGEIFNTLKSYLVNQNHSFQLKESHDDKIVFNTHSTYQQYFKNIPIDGAEVVEHSKNGFVYRIGGKIAEFDKNIEGHISKEEAIQFLDYQNQLWNGNEKWAWNDEDWETSLKENSNNPDTSYFPFVNGYLTWATYNYTTLDFIIPESNIRLAWRFEVFCLEPHFLVAYYVDAFTGEVFQSRSLIIEDGPAENIVYGPVTINTLSRSWPHNDHILYAGSGGLKVHTKSYYGNKNPITHPDGQAFFWAPEVKDEDDNWGSDEQELTTTHWFGERAWIYFQEVHDHSGMKGNGNKRLEIRANGPKDPTKTSYNTSSDIITISRKTNGSSRSTLDIVAHEYAHGVVRHSANFEYYYQSGALHEAFGDIFGVLAERYNEALLYPDRPFDWLYGEDVEGLSFGVRDLQNPKLTGHHIKPFVICDFQSGQPDTYFGQYWYNPDDFSVSEEDQCDKAGVHINNGVINKWFYLLVEGDQHNDINVLGIGFQKAEELIYYTLMNNLKKKSNFKDMRTETIEAAQELYGECSVMAQCVSDAWDAVQVPGISLNCFPQGINQDQLLINFEFNVYPNPASDQFTIQSQIPLDGLIKIIDLSGRTLGVYPVNNSYNFYIDVNIPSGYYSIQYHTEFNMISRPLLIVK